MRTSREWLSAMIGVLIMAGCSKDTVSPAEETQRKLMGRWDWVQTEYLSRGLAEPQLKTPATTQKRQLLEFKNDQRLLHYVNDTLKGTYFFEIEQVSGREFWLETDSSFSLIPAGSTPFTLDQNELLLQAGYNDLGGNSTFRKQK